MKLRLVTTALLCSSPAVAGGLFLPGSGAVSTTRAGAAVASAEDGEAISLNPAGIAKAKGTTVTIGIAAIDYSLSFQRNGVYPTIANDSLPYEGMPYPLMEDNAKPTLGIGPYQPVPVIGIVSDLGGRVKNLHAGFGLFAPNAYPARDLSSVGGNSYVFNSDFTEPPPSTRYDIIKQEAAIILPSLVVAYSVMPNLDVGARVSVGFADLKSTVAIWGNPANHEEWVKADALITLEAKDSFVPTGGFGIAYRPAPAIELGLNYSLPIALHASGDATPEQGPAVELGPGVPTIIRPVPDDVARCAPGGVATKLKGCADIQLPMTATIGGRYKILDAEGRMKGDIELDLGWEHWGAKCDYVNDPLCQNPSDYRVVVDAEASTSPTAPDGLALKDSRISHGLQDTFSIRLGGSYVIPAGTNSIIARGGVSYDTAAAKKGWERADIDGAARTMVSAGGSYKLNKVQIDAGFGFIYEGTRTDSRNCVVTGASGAEGCGPGGSMQPVDDRQGPDPTNPVINPNVQLEHPVNQGTYKSQYVMFMLGMSTWW